MEGAIVASVMVASTHLAAHFTAFQPWLPADLQTPMLSLAYGILPFCHLVVQLAGGFLWSAWVASSTLGIAR